jgi:hypothetical protein
MPREAERPRGTFFFCFIREFCVSRLLMAAAFAIRGFYASLFISFSRMATRLILPLMVFGRSSTNSTMRGYL